MPFCMARGKLLARHAVTKPKDRDACDSSEHIPNHMPAVACNSDDGCFSLKGHKPKSTVFSSVHPVSWHVDVHDITATSATKVSKQMLETCSQTQVKYSQKEAVRRSWREEQMQTCSTHMTIVSACKKVGCARRLDSPKFGEVVAYVALSGASDKLADKDAWASVSCRAALTAGGALTWHHLPILHAHMMWGSRHRV